ncbi:MAG TPA: penicillin-binding protein activator LpoB [Bacteroidales bacterium]|nr:penicillin-binding protein activator LpoB [Bacteroidales bacterium]
MKQIMVLSAVLIMILSLGCQRRTVTRIDPERAIDLSGRWNETDSRLVAQEMIADIVSHPWLRRFETSNGRVPVLIVGQVRNRSHEHIDAETFIRNMEREFVNNGTVRLVQGAEFREQIRMERADQHEFALPETIARWKREIGADFMLTGTMNSIVDQFRRDKIIYYQVNLELTDMETNEKVWIGEKQIKKAVSN